VSESNISYVKNECTGCGACYNVCPISAITMQEGVGGFLYPIVSDKCISCRKCVETCPAINVIKRKEDIIGSYAMVNGNSVEILKSSSGGIFLRVAKYVIENLNGVVFGTIYDKDFEVKIVKTRDEKEIEKMAGSKYLYSNTTDSFRQVEEELKNGNVVLYSGVSCQIAGLYSYLKKEYENLFTIEVLCHGAPSQGLFDKYVKHIEHKYNKKLVSINQRDKSLPWNPLITKRIRLKFDDGNEKVWAEDFDPYMSLYIREIAYRDVCYSCKYVGTKRNGDLVLGDFGGLGLIEKCQLDVKKGVSLVLINTKQGENLINMLEDINIEPRKLDEVIKLNSCLRSNVKGPVSREQFMMDYEKLSGEELFKKYYYNNYAYRMRAIIKRVMFTIVGPNNVAKIIYKRKK